MYTYTLQRESGASLRALKGQGWRPDATLRPRTDDSWCNRPGRQAQAVCAEPKIRWVVEAAGTTGWLTALALGAAAVAALLGG